MSIQFAPLVINTGVVTNPGWHLMFDQDPVLADMLVADKMRVIL